MWFIIVVKANIGLEIIQREPEIYCCIGVSPMTYFSRPYKILFIGHFYILPPLKLAFSRAQMSHAFFANPSIQSLLFTVNPHKNYISLLFLPKFLASHSHPFSGQHLFPETLYTINHYTFYTRPFYFFISENPIYLEVLPH